MIDRTKLPDFLQDMPKERLKEIMEEDDKADCFDKAMDKILHTDKKKQGRRKKERQELNPALLFRYTSVYWINSSSSE